MNNADNSRGGNGANDLETSDNDEDESSSTQQVKKEEIEEALSSFREKWHKELQFSSSKQKQTEDLKQGSVEAGNNNESGKDETDLEKATALFLKGSEFEKAGKLYEAIQFYRRAVQIVPDIESRIDLKKSLKESSPLLEADEVNNRKPSEDTSDRESDDDNNDSDDSIEEGQLLPRIQKKLGNFPTLCVPEIPQNTTHISVLPVEIILYIMRWLVSSDLDMRSLELCSRICRGFYLCARDSEIWRLACLRVWGRLNCERPTGFSSWREMFINKTRLCFNGCYISRTTYMRHGENNFQDPFYRPWHMITYYRYFRFFPDGIVLVLTTVDEPAQSVGLFKHRNAKHPVLIGYYRLSDDKVNIVINPVSKTSSGFKKNKRKDNNNHECYERTYLMELQIKDHHKRKNVQLVWKRYTITCNKKKQDFFLEMFANQYPPLWFSRVKSYTAESDSILQ